MTELDFFHQLPHWMALVCVRMTHKSGRLDNTKDTVGLERNNELMGTIPSEVQNMGSLKILNIDYNNFHGTISPAFSKLSNLRSWNSSFNEMDGTVPVGICELHYLETLIVDCDKLVCPCCKECP